MNEKNASANAGLFAQLGSSEHLLIREHEQWKDTVLQVHTHEISGVGQLLCLDTGLIEPLSQSMYVYAAAAPAEFIKLARYAEENQLHFLAWRILTVNSLLKGSTDQTILDASEEVADILGPWWSMAIEAAIHH